MRPQLFLGLLHERPFRPFRVHVSDGAWYDVPHPEAALVSGPTLIVMVRTSGFAGPPGERHAHVSLIHVTRVEVYYPGLAPAP
jgi:hypothetical protein